MRSETIKNKKVRLRFPISSEFSKRLKRICKLKDLTLSEFARHALCHYINKVEKDRIEKELIAGYQANYDYYLKLQKDWQYADISSQY